MSGRPVTGPAPAALADMTVVDISQQLPGPYASMLLQGLGARVIKVEPPAGDPSRLLDPRMFAMANAGKETVRLDLKEPADVVRLHELVSSADVFLEGFRPGVAGRLGAGVQTLTALNPRLVYCSISAAGQDGPYSQAPMHDLNLQGLAALDPGQGIGVPWVDLGTASMAALGIVSSWQAARDSGRGCYLDTAMLDTAVLWARVKDSAHGRVEPTYGIFPSADGGLVAVAILEDHIWQRLCQAFGWADWQGAPALGSYLQRVEVAQQIQDRLARDCAARPFEELLALARDHDLPVTPAGTRLGDEATAQLAARGLVAPGASAPRSVPLPVVSVPAHPQDRA